jgi:flavin-binding protein dodecin
MIRMGLEHQHPGHRPVQFGDPHLTSRDESRVVGGQRGGRDVDPGQVFRVRVPDELAHRGDIVDPGGSGSGHAPDSAPSSACSPSRPRRHTMPGRTYRVTEVVGTSSEGVDDAIKGAIGRAARTLRGLDWFEVTEIRGHIVDGQLGHVQVGLKVGFRLENPEDEG